MFNRKAVIHIAVNLPELAKRFFFISLCCAVKCADLVTKVVKVVCSVG